MQHYLQKTFDIADVPITESINFYIDAKVKI